MVGILTVCLAVFSFSFPHWGGGLFVFVHPGFSFVLLVFFLLVFFQRLCVASSVKLHACLTDLCSLGQSRGWECFSLSDVLRMRLRERGLEPTRELLVQEGNTLRDGPEGAGALGVAACEYMQQYQRDHPAVPGFVVDSIRHPQEVLALRKYHQEEKCANSFRLLALDAPVLLRWKRCGSRGREGDPTVTLQDFVQADDRELYGLAGSAATSQSVS